METIVFVAEVFELTAAAYVECVEGIRLNPDVDNGAR